MGKSEIHQKLSAATAAVHERLHGHEGFAAAAGGTIDLASYRDLLARLWGFHRGFEIALDEAVSQRGLNLDVSERRRSPLIEQDLLALAVAPGAVAEWPIWACRRVLENRAQILGALYVIEGSTLGGIHIARALEPVVRHTASDGRRFFFGYGARHGIMWRQFLDALEDGIVNPLDEAEAVKASRDTFSAFENWMRNWRGAATQRATPTIRKHFIDA